jgi:hypothetical protein
LTMCASTFTPRVTGARRIPVRRRHAPSARRVPAGLLCVISSMIACVPLHGQEAPEPVRTDSTALFAPVTPATAFLRAVLVPGWGHASIGTYTRAGFYFALEATTVYGLLRTQKRLNEVAARAEFRENVVRDDLAAQGIVKFDEIESALDADVRLDDLRDLEESRRQQREDWAALGIFLLLLSGADAYVSAHLRDFPAPIQIQAAPAGGGRIEVGVHIEVGGN